VIFAGAANALPGLVINADVETDLEPDGFPNDWFKSSNGVSYPDDNGPSSPGSKAIQIDVADRDWRSSTFPVVPGAVYRWSFDYKFLQGATGDFRADLRFFDGGVFKGEDAPLIAASNIGQWQKSSRLVTVPAYVPDVPALPNQADIRMSSNLFAPGNGLVRFDNFIVLRVPEPATLTMLGGAIGAMVLAFGRRRRG
jgi:hypothetical protein